MDQEGEFSESLLEQVVREQDRQEFWEALDFLFGNGRGSNKMEFLLESVNESSSLLIKEQ